MAGSSFTNAQAGGRRENMRRRGNKFMRLADSRKRMLDAQKGKGNPSVATKKP